MCRNPNLANVFYRLQLIEVYGTGMRKIMGDYADKEQKPVIRITGNAFKIILPNVNSDSSFAPDAAGMDSEDKVLSFLKRNGAISRLDVENQLGVSASTASRLLRCMAEKGLLLSVGKARSTKYVLPEN